jgi:hypothetical protein
MRKITFAVANSLDNYIARTSFTVWISMKNMALAVLR